MRTYIMPYKMGSASAKLLAKELNCLRIRKKNSKFNPTLEKKVINWGCSASQFDQNPNFNVLNHPLKVTSAVNKLDFFKTAAAKNLLGSIPYCERMEDVQDFMYPVVCRTVLNGHSGEGIVIADTPEEIVPAPLYTSYIKKKTEFRVHIFRDFLTGYFDYFIQRKIRKRDAEGEANWRIRNLDGGFIYIQYEGDKTQRLASLAEHYRNAFNLNFCAVDILYNQRYDKFYVLEINTSPGLSKHTLEFYSNCFNNIY